MKNAKTKRMRGGHLAHATKLTIKSSITAVPQNVNVRAVSLGRLGSPCPLVVVRGRSEGEGGVKGDGASETI